MQTSSHSKNLITDIQDILDYKTAYNGRVSLFSPSGPPWDSGPTLVSGAGIGSLLPHAAYVHKHAAVTNYPFAVLVSTLILIRMLSTWTKSF
jgi:hypothetical protein